MVEPAHGLKRRIKKQQKILVRDSEHHMEMKEVGIVGIHYTQLFYK